MANDNDSWNNPSGMEVTCLLRTGLLLEANQDSFNMLNLLVLQPRAQEILPFFPCTPSQNH